MIDINADLAQKSNCLWHNGRPIILRCMRFIVKKVIIKFIRWSLGRLILLLNAIFSPRRLKRPPEIQKQIDEQTQQLKLYQYNACPFCVMARRTMKRLNLNIETRDPRHNPTFHEELINKGGKLKVPCLRVEDEGGQVEWIYESSNIVSYLQTRFTA